MDRALLPKRHFHGRKKGLVPDSVTCVKKSAPKPGSFATIECFFDRADGIDVEYARGQFSAFLSQLRFSNEEQREAARKQLLQEATQAGGTDRLHCLIAASLLNIGMPISPLSA